jgi:uncharacterized SAM-binding protein YcdF (DUF218 family)
MAFALTKLVHFLAQPINLVLALLLLALVFGRLGRRRIARALRWTAIVFVAAVLGTPLSEAAMQMLQQRFPPPGPEALDQAAGAIVLGGSTGDGAMAEAIDGWIVNDAAERLFTIVSLRQRRPDLPVIHTGGTARVFHEGWKEGDIVRAFLADTDVDPASVLFEERSRTTWENALYTAEMLDGGEAAPGDPRPWLLVTSAWHMPRAIGAFREAGIPVIAYPVDYWGRPPSWRPDRINTYERMRLMTRAMLEFVGLAAYRALGRSDALFPAP